MDFVPSETTRDVDKKFHGVDMKFHGEDPTNDPLSGREDFFPYEFIGEWKNYFSFFSFC